MTNSPPFDEPARVAALREYRILDTGSEDEFDDLTKLAAYVCGTSAAAISLVDEDRVWFKSSIGFDACQIPREQSFCNHNLSGEMLVVADATQEPLFQNLPVVTGDEHLRFYAGAPLVTRDGVTLGALCVLDCRPRTLSEAQFEMLRTLGHQVVSRIELRHSLIVQQEMTAERGRAEKEKADLLAYNRLLLESTAEGIYGMDTQGLCTFINAAAMRMLGCAADDVLGKSMHKLIHHTHQDGTAYPVEDCPIYKAFQIGQGCQVDTEVLHRLDGTSFRASYASFPMSTEADGIVGAVVTFSDITQRLVEHEYELKLREAIERAERDPLTGLLNHRSFQKRLEEEADRAQREGTTLAVAVMDLDNFKFFNDAYGHVAGDQVLREVSCALYSTCRSYDVLARFGGDEFAMLLPGIDNPEGAVEAISARLRGALEGIGFCPPGAETPVPILLTAGVALFPDECPTRSDAVEMADARLRRSKIGSADETLAERLSLSLAGTIPGFAILYGLVTAVDAKDRYTRRHSEDVMQYSLEIARELGLSEEEQRIIATAALLHDVGKIGVPDQILRKPGSLTELEFAAVRQHPQMGAAIVGAEPSLSLTLDAVRHHHERWDGEGYPEKLSGEAIPLHARIMAVADAFSAMTTDRPYRQGMPYDKALAILWAGAGTQWDPECVRAFCRVKEAANDASAPPPLLSPKPEIKPITNALPKVAPTALPPQFRFSGESGEANELGAVD